MMAFWPARELTLKILKSDKKLLCFIKVVSKLSILNNLN